MLSNQPSCPLLGLLALPAGGLPPTATEAGVREAVAEEPDHPVAVTLPVVVVVVVHIP